MNLPEAFGTVLRTYRKRAGMTQEQLGFEAGVERNYVSMLELGQRQPTLGTLFSLAHAMNVRPSELVAMLEQGLNGSPEQEFSE